MKKILKGIVSLALIFVVTFSLTACKDKISDTTVDTSKVKSINGATTNGGMTLVHGDYLYFINGTKTNDGTSSSGNKRAGIYRVKYNVETGEIDEDTYERVVSSLAGFSNGSLYIFGDFLYYAVPSETENYKGEVLYNKVKFMRHDLVHGKDYEVYTTNMNTSGTVSYQYYVVGDSLNLVVYESVDSSITSLKIGKDTSTNYKITNVTSCLLADNNGKSLVAGQVDANNFVYYTTGHSAGEEVQTGVKVYRTSPVSKNPKLLSDDGEDVSLVCVRNGKLVYSVDTKVYAVAINGTDSDALSFEFDAALTFNSLENTIFMENEDGSISILSYNTDTFALAITTWKNGNLTPHPITTLSGAEDDKFSLVGLVIVDEEVEVPAEEPADPDAGEGEGSEPESQAEEEPETKIEKVQYLIYVHNSKIYKIEIARENAEGDMVLTKYPQPIKLTTSDVQAPEGLLVPEVIGNQLFVLAADDNKNVYMHVVDISITEDSEDKATLIGVKE